MPSTRKRTIISFLFESERPEAVKIVGRLHRADTMLNDATRWLPAAPAVIGPKVATEDSRALPRGAFLVSALDGQPGAHRLLMLACESVPVPAESDVGPLLMFLGGFDPPAIALNPSLATSMLALQYPAVDVARPASSPRHYRPQTGVAQEPVPQRAQARLKHAGRCSPCRRAWARTSLLGWDPRSRSSDLTRLVCQAASGCAAAGRAPPARPTAEGLPGR